METPTLNPTGGVTPKPPLGLEYQKDSTRPGGGVFIARTRAREEDIKDLPAGTIISPEEDKEGLSFSIINLTGNSQARRHRNPDTFGGSTATTIIPSARGFDGEFHPFDQVG
jgi:hypothetical protein